jgi:formiminoglutamase
MTWTSIADLFEAEGEVALLGAPMEAGSVTPGRCDLAPETLRRILRRFSIYDLETARELAVRLHDAGDVAVRGLMPVDGFAPIRDAVRACTERHDLTLLIGGNNAVTRPAVHGVDLPLDRIGLITLDAHFDLRETDQGLLNGNPIRALLEDGLPGRNICQIGLAPFANTAKMHHDARAEGIGSWSIAACRNAGISSVVGLALTRLDHVDALVVDFDIDVIDRASCPGAPGARPGGLPVEMFFAAARRLAAEPRVRLVDLTEFDPSRDLGDITAFVAGRWVCEILAGYSVRQ